MRYVVFTALGLLPILMVASAIYVRQPHATQAKWLCAVHLATGPEDCP